VSRNLTTVKNSSNLLAISQSHLSFQQQRDYTSVGRAPYGEFYHQNLLIQKTKSLKVKPPAEQLVFGKVFTDHMMEVQWTEKDGWGKPQIIPYHKLELPPSCSALHYAIQCFEGMKAYKGENGKDVYLFRPDMNAARLNRSCARLGLPNFSNAEFIKCLAEFVHLERDWIPEKFGYSLYIRPTVISTEETLGVLPPKSALLYVIMSPVGPYFKTGFKPVKLLAEPKYIRAFPGGTGSVKLGANYGPTILPQIEAADRGYNQVLWLFGENHEITEVGTMNIFFYWINEKGEEELVTPPLVDIVLPGVTRDTIINITRNEWGMRVSERKITMRDVIRSVDEGRMLEAFGVGTACVVAPISAINFKEKEYEIPAPSKEEGSLAHKLFDHVLNIQYGKIDSQYCWSVKDILAEKNAFLR
jgi:branched-chain amino acid aminotransferase